jgi:SAM-dependent methyltransferase
MLDAEDVPMLRAFGWGKGSGVLKQVDGAVEILIQQGLVTDSDILQVTEKGRADLREDVWSVDEVAFYARIMEPRTKYVHAPFARRIIQNLPSLPDNPLIVDVGTGPGFLCFELAKLLAEATFVGIDPSPYAVELAQQFAEKAGLARYEARCAKAEQLPVITGAVDLVVSRESLHEWEDAQAAFSEIYRVLKPGGYLALEDLNRAYPRWMQTLFVVLTGLGAGPEINRERLRSFQSAFTLEEVKAILIQTGFAILKGEKGLYLRILAAKQTNVIVT